MADLPWDERLQFMIAGALQGLSGASVLRELRAGGIGGRTQDFYRIWGTARSIAAEAGLEPTRPLNERPTLGQMTPVATNGAQGVLQTTRLVYKERVTGNIRVVYHNVKSDTPMTRQEAIQAAIDAYGEHDEEYQTDLISAVHTSAIRLIPVTVTE